jgi:hypothetical protein
MGQSKPQVPHPTLPKTRKPEPAVGTTGHKEWLVDEAEEESFPASDPSAEAMPGSSAGKKGKKEQPKKK